MLDHYGFGGILADDMGLGKTLQTIAFLTSKLTPETRILILSPSSLIYNWQDEFTRFAPEIDVVVAYGLKAVRDDIISQNHQVVITSYSSFRQDFDEYSQLNFDYLILDEAQVMKNTQTKIAHYLRQFKVKNCFALSGTPIENKLLEIWSIFQIVLPGLLPDKKRFLKMEAKQVARFIKPFIMRRRKEEVLPELPDLIEINYPNELDHKQKAIYLAQLRQMQETIAGASDADINRRKIEILSGITRLRQICDTPSLFMDYNGESGKLDSLRTLLIQVKENGHRALIFSQFRGMLDIAEKEIEELGLTSYKITGSTPANARQEMTRAFNNGSKDTFLISLKAGGVGLNLTGADTVILIDIWWNPAVEMQAISRAHRIGQKANVEVYRLITRGTIEEKILEMQESKKNLVTTVLDGNETRASMTIEDIKEILGVD
ncbi:ATP-dependent helicase HepA [Streptococcus pasteurianus]|nr:ATP-dependent helicase HepA [Streptococcus pasteurianus]